MKSKKLKPLLLSLEIVGFILTYCIIWLDELVDLPHLLFGAPQGTARFPEALMESTLILIVAVGVVSSTLWLFKRIEQLESYIVMCAWCRKIKTEDERWVTIEEYMWEKDERQISHGLCKSCAERQMKMLSEGLTEPSGRTL